MLDNVLSFLGFDSGISGEDARRKHVRRDGAAARIMIGDNVYPVHDWDMRGISFQTTPENYLEAGAKVHMRIAFALPHETIYVEQDAIVCRSAHRGISAALFTEMLPATRRQLDRVVDGMHAQEFLMSQVA